MSVPTVNSRAGVKPPKPASPFARAFEKWLVANFNKSMVAPIIPATKDISLHPAFRYLFLSRMTWRFLNYRFTRAGRRFLSLTLILAFVGATSLEIQNYIAFLYAAALWSVAVGATLLQKPRVRVETRHAERVRAGDTLQVEALVTNMARRMVYDWHILPFRLPLEVDCLPTDGVPVGTLAPNETRRVTFGLAATRRGSYRLRGVRVETDFPFGLLNAYTSVWKEEPLLVYPAYTPLSRLDLPIGRTHHPGGVALISRLGESMEYLGNREYREGDSVRDIDWRATARMGGMPVVREWREEYLQRVGVVLDTFVPPDLSARAAREREAAFERAVSLCAAVSDYMAAQDYLVDIFAAGPNLYHLTAGRSLAYLDQILDILACVETSSVEPLDTVEPQIQENLQLLNTVICVFIQWDDTRRGFVERLRQGGAGVKLILLAQNEETDGIPPDMSLIGAYDFVRGVNTL